MKPDGFTADLRRKPEVLGRLASTLAVSNPWAAVVPKNVDRVVLLGMGSSAYAGGVAAAAEGSAHLLASESDWRPEVSELLLGPTGTHFAAPAHRFCSAQQAALMLREGPRLAAVGCETGDWSHVDVYLTKTTDYRLAVFAGSAWEAQLAEWTTARGSTVVGIGGDVPGAGYHLRYPGDTDDDVRLLTEVLVAELVAAAAWQG